MAHRYRDGSYRVDDPMNRVVPLMSVYQASSVRGIDWLFRKRNWDVIWLTSSFAVSEFKAFHNIRKPIKYKINIKINRHTINSIL